MTARAFRSIKRPTPEQLVEETRRNLQKAADAITSREHFEQILWKSTNPERMRELLEPLLRKNLPCCAESWRGQHTQFCPGLPEVAELHDDELSRFEGEGGLVEVEG